MDDRNPVKDSRRGKPGNTGHDRDREGERNRTTGARIVGARHPVRSSGSLPGENAAKHPTQSPAGGTVGRIEPERSGEHDTEIAVEAGRHGGDKGRDRQR